MNGTTPEVCTDSCVDSTGNWRTFEPHVMPLTESSADVWGRGGGRFIGLSLTGYQVDRAARGHNKLN